MIFKCIYNDESLAPPVHQNDVQVHPAYIHTDLTVGGIYVIYAVGVYSDDLQFLVQSDSKSATWVSPHLFEPVDSRLPPYWEFVSFAIEGSERWQRRTFQAIWGYPRLVTDPLHNDRLLEWDPEEVAHFEEEIERPAKYEM